jgi:hypothetical protein
MFTSDDFFGLISRDVILSECVLYFHFVVPCDAKWEFTGAIFFRWNAKPQARYSNVKKGRPNRAGPH